MSPLPIETLSPVHTREYLVKLATIGLSDAEQRRLGLPWSEALWLRSRLASAGTLLAAIAKLVILLYGIDMLVTWAESRAVWVRIGAAAMLAGLMMRSLIAVVFRR